MTKTSLQKTKNGTRHSFAIMAYKTAPFLERTVASILNQNSNSQIYMTTSTPNERIEFIARNNNIPLHINTGKAGIVGDWEYALSCAQTPYVTLVDQDDIYQQEYGSTVIDLLDKHPDALIAFTNYLEINNEGAVRKTNKTMRMKHFLLWPYLFASTLRRRFWRRMILRIGNPICSPSVTYNLANLARTHLFDESYSMSLDWDAWLQMTELKGSFCYSKKPLMNHRIHEATQTSGGISGGRRYEEDLSIYERLWPNWIARLLAKAYSASYRTNE